MHYSEIMIRYGELSTKGKNKKSFIRQLHANVQSVLSSYSKAKVFSNHDRMYIELNGEPVEPIQEKLKNIFGIQTFSPVLQVEKTSEAMYEAAIHLMKESYQEGMTFKVATKRADKNFPMDTPEVNREVGAAIIEAIPGIQAQMKQPDVMVQIEIREPGIFIFTEKLDGPGGFPVGTGGKAMLMLSGGIDSPVAGYLTLKKGVEIEAVHFYSPPYTSPQALTKAKDLTAKLAKYVGKINFITVPFTAIQEEIKEKIEDAYSMTINRRFMMRITDRLRAERDALAIVNGESIGQVASQTLESMFAINEVTSSPVLRPLVSMDKEEIVDIAKEIDTYDLSIQPYEDCCTVFAPQRPKTKPDLGAVQHLESRLDVERLTQAALDQVTVESIKPDQSSQDQAEERFSSFF